MGVVVYGDKAVCMHVQGGGGGCEVERDEGCGRGDSRGGGEDVEVVVAGAGGRFGGVGEGVHGLDKL